MGSILTDIGLTHYLMLSAVLFTMGVVVIMTRRNGIAILMGIEMMLNAAGINFVAFNKYSAPERLDGQIFTVFIILLAVAEAAAALAIVLNIYHQMNSIRLDEADALKE